jgi:hypothetical protein
MAADELGGGRQATGAAIAEVPAAPVNASGVPTNNPAPGAPAVSPVSPAVARVRAGAAAAQGHGNAGGNK